MLFIHKRFYNFVLNKAAALAENVFNQRSGEYIQNNHFNIIVFLVYCCNLKKITNH